MLKSILMFNKLDAILQQTIRGLFLTLFFFLPLIFWIPNSEVFELPKMYFVYAMTTLIVGLWLMRMVLAGRIIWRRTPLDIPILLFLLSQIASTIYSIDPHVSWFGWYGRFNGGLWSTISYTLLYYALVSNLSVIGFPFSVFSSKSISRQSAGPKPTNRQPANQNPITENRGLITVALASAAVVSAYALLQHFGIDKNFWIQDVMNRVFSTQGQPNWLGAYIVMVAPLVLAMTIMSNGITFYFLLIIFFASLLFTKSRSGLLGFAVADVVFWAFIFTKARPFVKRPGLNWLIIHLGILFLILATNNPVLRPSSFFPLPSSLNFQPSPTKSELGGTESGDIRKIVWNGAVQLAKQRPILGFGPETFGLTYWQVRPKEANLTSEWNFLYNKAHNEWLNLAANTGLFGFGSHLLLVGWFTVWALLSVFRSRFSDSGYPVFQSIRPVNRKPTDLKLKTDNRELITVAILAALLGVEVINFFGFSTVTTETYRYLFMGIAVMIVIREQRTENRERKKYLPFAVYCLLFAVFLATIYLIIQISDLFRADLNYNLGRQFYSAGYAAEALEPLSQAVNLAPNEPVFRNELAEIQAMLAISLSAQDPSSLTPQDDIEPLKEAALVNFRIVSGQSKYNLTFTRTQAQMEFLMRKIDPDLTGEALLLAQKAIDLSPTDPRGYYLLGRMYGELDDKIRAEKLYRQALELKPDYGEARKMLNL